MNEIVVEIINAVPEVSVNLVDTVEIVASMESATPEIVVEIIGTGPQGKPGASAEALTNQDIDDLLNNFI